MKSHAQPSLPSEKADSPAPTLHPDVRLTLDVLIAARRERLAQTLPTGNKSESSAA